MNENIKIDFDKWDEEEYQYKLYENYITFPFYSKVNIIYSDEVDKKMIVFSWDDTEDEYNLSQILKNVKGCKIVLPIGYNIKDI